jgi:hypothetical protein
MFYVNFDGISKNMYFVTDLSFEIDQTFFLRFLFYAFKEEQVQKCVVEFGL